MSLHKIELNVKKNSLKIGSDSVMLDYSKSQQDKIFQDVKNGSKEYKKLIRAAEQREKHSWIMAKVRQVSD